MPYLELACFNLRSVQTACEAGVDRIELCIAAELGGVTPDLDLCKAAYEHTRSHAIPLHIMIRTRGGDFVYSQAEFEEMQTQLASRKQYADGFVLGVLTVNHNIDVARTQSLVDLAHPLPCTFHRAFDETSDSRQALEDVKRSGCTAILSAGGIDAMFGRYHLAELRQHCHPHITLISGGGIRAINIKVIHEIVGGEWYHSSAMRDQETAANKQEILNMRSKLLT